MTKSLTSEEIIEVLAGELTALPRGTRLPSEGELGERFEASRGRIRHVLAVLQASGIIARRQGSGTYVSHPYPFPLSSTRASLHAQVTQAGGEVRTVSFGTSRLPSDDATASWLGVVPGTMLTQLQRLGYIDGEPGITLCEWFAPGILDEVGVAVQIIESVDEILLSAGFRPRRARFCSRMVLPDPAVRHHLGLGAGQHACLVRSLLVDGETGKPLVVSANHSNPALLSVVIDVDFREQPMKSATE